MSENQCEPNDDERTEHVLICADTIMAAVPGSLVSKCSLCGGKVWIAPSGQKALKSGGDWRVQCPPCTMPDIIAGMPAHLVPGAKEEVQSWLDGQMKAATAHNN